MRIKAILTSVVLGSSLLAGVASADPIVRDHRYEPVATQFASQPYGYHVDRDGDSVQPYGYQVDRDGDSVQPYAYGQDPSREYTPRASWINLAEDARLGWRGVAVLPASGQRLTAIELQGERGTTFIQEVRVQLTDGRVIRVNTQRMLDREHAPNLRVDLGDSARCGVRRVVLIGRGGGQFRMLGA